MLVRAQSGPVEVAALPPADPATASACAALLAALPPEIDPGVERREVTGAPDRVAAWGDPAVVLRCGVPAPGPLVQLLEVNRVQWSVTSSEAGSEWTTVGRAPTVSVMIPKDYEQSGGAELILPLSPSILATLPASAPTSG